MGDNDSTRRAFLTAGVALAPGVLALGTCGGKKAEDVDPPEDLMREHGVLNRILLIYDESIRRIQSKPDDLPPEVLSGAADIIKRFIEDYHEKLEEDFLFPRFEKANTLTDLVGLLRDQHAAGRRTTAQIVRLATAAGLKNDHDRQELAGALAAFIRMYRPHEAREDTVLFPSFRKIVSPGEFDALGDQFEDKEHELFGQDGFEHMVDRVADLEKRLGIYDLAQFTPRS
jgi:hemerythrin-like domain-containing protein